MERDAILLTPGPLTTTARTKRAMLRDWGSWDSSFNAITAELRRQLLDDRARRGHARRRAAAGQRHLRGRGRGRRRSCRATATCWCSTTAPTASALGKLATLMGRSTTILGHAEDEPVSPAELEAALRADASITHVGLIHCETGTGVLNPLQAIADGLRAPRQGPDRRRDELVRGAADRRARGPLRRARRRQRQVPRGRAGHGLRLHRARTCSTAPPATRTRSRWTCTTSTSTWRRPASGASRRRRTWSPRSPRRCASSRRRAASRRAARATRENCARARSTA